MGGRGNTQVAEGVQDEVAQIQDKIIEALEWQNKFVSQGKLRKLVKDGSAKKFRDALKDLEDKKSVRVRKSGKYNMYADPEVYAMEEHEKQIDAAAKALAKMKNEFPRYAPGLQFDILDATERILKLRPTTRPTPGEKFDNMSDEDYEESCRQALAALTVEGQDLIHGGKLVVKREVKKAVRKACEEGRALRRELRERYAEILKEIAKSPGRTPKRKEESVKKKNVEALEEATTRLATRMEYAVSSEIYRAKSVMKKNGQGTGASPFDDEVGGSTYGRTMDMLDYRKELDELQAKFEHYLYPDCTKEIAPKIEAIRAAMKDARKTAYRMHVESMSGTESAVYRAAENMREGIACCAVIWAARGGPLKEPFSEKEAARHAGEQSPDFAGRSKKGPGKIFEGKDSKYEIDKTPRGMADAVLAGAG